MALTRRVPRLALALVVLALVVRLGFVAATPGYTPQHDDHDYDRLACGLVAGEGYSRNGPPTPRSGCGEGGGEPTAFRPPGFPMFLAAVYTAAEPVGIQRWTAARIALAFLGTAAVALLGIVAWQLWGRRAGLAALALGALFPPAIVLGGSLLTETLFVTLMLAAIAAALADRARGGDRRWLVATGVLCGLAVLTRSNAPALILPLMICVATTGAGKPLRARIGRALALAGIAALVVAPWTLRNAVALDGFAPVTTEAGSALAGTYNDATRNNPHFPGRWVPPGNLPEIKPDLDPVRGDEPKEQRVLIDRSREYMADNPGYVAEIGGRNLLRLSGFEGRDWWQFSGRSLSLPRWTHDVSGVGFLLFLALAVAGAFTRTARAAPWWLWLMPVLMLLSVLFVVGETRFRAPTDPFVVLLAAALVAQLVASKRNASPAA